MGQKEMFSLKKLFMSSKFSLIANTINNCQCKKKGIFRQFPLEVALLLLSSFSHCEELNYSEDFCISAISLHILLIKVRGCKTFILRKESKYRKEKLAIVKKTLIKIEKRC